MTFRQFLAKAAKRPGHATTTDLALDLLADPRTTKATTVEDFQLFAGQTRLTDEQWWSFNVLVNDYRRETK